MKPGYGLSVAQHWYALGPLEIVEDIAQRFPEAQVSPDIPSSSGATEDGEHKELNSCIIAASTTLVTYVMDPDQYGEDIVHLGQMYPGLDEVVESLLSSTEEKALREEGDVSSSEFQGHLSQYGGPLKSYCRDLLEAKR